MRLTAPRNSRAKTAAGRSKSSRHAFRHGLSGSFKTNEFGIGPPDVRVSTAINWTSSLACRPCLVAAEAGLIPTTCDWPAMRDGTQGQRQRTHHRDNHRFGKAGLGWASSSINLAEVSGSFGFDWAFDLQTVISGPATRSGSGFRAARETSRLDFKIGGG
jgi:hypothetical protein